MSDDPIPYDFRHNRINRTSVATQSNKVIPMNPPPKVPLSPVIPKAPQWVIVALGIVATALMGVSTILPPPFGVLATIVAFVCAGLSGAGLPAPSWAAGAPVVQGAAVGIATTLSVVGEQLALSMADGWPKLAASTAALLAAWFAGRAAPALGGH